jgi:hypothetical protein
MKEVIMKKESTKYKLYRLLWSYSGRVHRWAGKQMVFLIMNEERKGEKI